MGCTCRGRVRSSGAWNDRVVEADGDLVSSQRVEAVNELGSLVECSGVDEPQDGAEIGYILDVSSGQDGLFRGVTPVLRTKPKPNRIGRFGVSDPPGYDIA